MKFHLLLTLVLLVNTLQFCMAQSQMSQLRGMVVDGSNSQPLPFASVSLSLQHGESTNIIGVVQTGMNGEFLFDKLSFGTYALKVSFVGFLDAEQMIELKENGVIDLKSVKLQPQSKMLSEVEVTAEKSQIDISPGKRIFNVEKNLTAIGGTA